MQIGKVTDKKYDDEGRVETTGKERGVKTKHSSDIRRRIVISRVKRKLLRHVLLVRVGIVAGVIAVIIFFVGLTFSLIRNTTVGFYINLASDFIFTPMENIEVIDGRTNVLILGKGGQNHNAPDLTDTIMFASFDHQIPSVNVISLPRDIWVPALRAKLNSMYFWGNEKEGGGGLKLAKSSVEEIVGQPVHYGLVIDFDGFQEIINVMDGVEVDVENSFTDRRFPIEGKENDECDGDPEYKCRYETITFKSGTQTMDGETALKYVRSRNAEGDEGTDVARAARQQKLLAAIKERILSSEILLSSSKLLNLKDAAIKYIETDINSNSAAILARRVYQARDNISSHVLPEDFLISPPKSYRYDNLYVFIPAADDPSTGLGQGWSEVHNWTKCVIKNSNCNTSTQDKTEL
jgi:LCP family protein required for cell wall assembly